MPQHIEIYDPKSHTDMRIPITLIYKEGDILLLPVPATWNVEHIEEFRVYAKEMFSEFKDIRFVPDMICAQILRKEEEFKYRPEDEEAAYSGDLRAE